MRGARQFQSRRTPSHAARFYNIEQRDGRRLADLDARPIRWSDRDALAFRSEQEAWCTAEKFFGRDAGRELLGIRVVQA